MIGILEERLRSIGRDVELIISDVENSGKHPVFTYGRFKELESALHGMDTVLKDLQELRDSARVALNRYERHLKIAAAK